MTSPLTDYLILLFSAVRADDDDEAKVEDDIGKSRDGSRTDDEAVQRLVTRILCLLLSLLVVIFVGCSVTFDNSLDPDQARQNVRPFLHPNCLTLMVYLKDSVEIHVGNILKMVSR